MNKTAANLRWLRKTYGLTTAQLALVTGQPERKVVEWETGEKLPGNWSYRAICAFFETDKYALIRTDLHTTHLFTERRWSRIHRSIERLQGRLQANTV